MNENEYEIIEIDDNYAPVLTKAECAEFKPMLTDFVGSYAKNQDRSVDVWLQNKLQESLPEKSSEEIKKMSDEIILAIKTDDEKKASLTEAVKSGQSKERWFASEMTKVTSGMSTLEAAKYLDGLDSAIASANEALYRTITTKSGNINQNPQLDGFIAEQYHAQTFNMNAKAAGSSYRAEVLEPNGSGYAKNSVDLVIKDPQGNVVKRYQSKYCKDADTTAKAFEKGDYRGQQKLVPDGQQADIPKKCTNVIESPDGIKSNPLSKSRAEQMRNEAQSGKWDELNWNEYKIKDLKQGIAKQTCNAAVMGAACGAGIEIIEELRNGEDIQAEKVVEASLKSGEDFGIKAAAAGALKVGVEKDIIKVIPKGTPASTIANIAFVAVEDVKVMADVASGELSVSEGINKLEETTVSTAAGLAAMTEGSGLGAAIGTVFGPVGTAVGGFIGGTVGYIAGSKVGSAVIKGVQKIRDKATTVFNYAAQKAKDAFDLTGSTLSNVLSFFGI